MRFFSKITFICNLCFVAFVVLRQLEKNPGTMGSRDAIIPLPAVEGTLAILGLVAVLVNFIFVVLLLVLALLKKQHGIAKWLVWVNLLFLLVQLFYFKLF